jgi:hypothetical protein
VKQALVFLSLLIISLAFGRNAHARVRGHALAGANATQVKVISTDETTVSNGYASYAVGGGFSVFSESNIALSADAFYTNRKFGFGETSATFSTIQVPLMARYYASKLYLGTGVYAALWSFKGEMVTNGESKSVKVSDAGQSSTDLGFLVSTGIKQRIFGLPLLFEIRRFQSLNDIAKSSTFKGSLVEWQILAGYQFNDDTMTVKTPPPAPRRSGGTKGPVAAPPPVLLNKPKPIGDEGLVILPPESAPSTEKSSGGGQP